MTLRVSLMRLGLGTALLLIPSCQSPPCECRCVVDTVEVCAGEARVRPARDGAPLLPERELTFNYDAARELQIEGEVSASLRFIERVVNIDPNFRDIYFLRGFALQQTGRLPEAIESYQRHIARFPEDAKAWFNLGHAQMSLELYGEAIASLKESTRLDPQRKAAYEHLATCFEALSRPQDARAARNKAAAIP